MFVYTANNVIAQEINVDDFNDSTKKISPSIYAGFETSALLHTNPHYKYDAICTFPSGLSFSLLLNKNASIGLSTSFLYDFTAFSYKYSNIWTDTNNVVHNENFSFQYHYISNSILFNLYFKSIYFSIGCMNRFPVFYPSKYNEYAIHYIPNSYTCFQIGGGTLVHLKNKNWRLQIEPRIIFAGNTKQYFGGSINVVATRSSGFLLGVQVKLTHKIITF